MCDTLAVVVDFFFFFNDTATTEIYTLSLHDALPISQRVLGGQQSGHAGNVRRGHGSPTGRQIQIAEERARNSTQDIHPRRDRKSTRLNSSHGYISYAVFCLKKKKRY